MSRALEHTIRVNSAAAESVQVVMVDKDLNEIRVLRSYFPNARVLICLFHVIKYLKQASRKPEYGRLSEDDHDAVDALVHNMVYAVSAEIYETNRASLEALRGRTGFAAFFTYMEANWHSCIDMWVMYQRAKLPHLKVHTKNHLENWFGHFKDAVSASMSMAQTVKALVGYDARISIEYVFDKARVGVRVNSNYAEEMSQVLRFTTHFVAAHVERQYVMASEKEDVFEYDTVSQTGSVVVTDDRVVFFRWLHPTDQPVVSRPFMLNAFRPGVAKKVMNSNTKYKDALSAMQAICNELADIEDDDEYREHLTFVLDQWRNVRQRKRIMVRQESWQTSTQDRCDMVEIVDQVAETRNDQPFCNG
ncbi:hypothetical protein BBJ28_00010923, partial [Nothophytophthora sp. Chile5]